MMRAGPAGFANAPVSKGLLWSSIGLTLLSSATQAKNSLFLFSYSDLLRNKQFWRLVTHNVTYRSAGELFLGSILLYNLRIFERQMGSKKFGAFTFVVCVISTSFQLALSARGFGQTSPGLFAPIFSGVVLFYQVVPVSRRFHICGIPLSDKFLIYLLSFQLALCSTPSSCYSAFCGLLSGMLYTSDLLPFKRFRFPRFFNNLCSRFLLPLLRSSSENRRVSSRNNHGMNGEEMSGREEGQGYRDRLIGGQPMPRHAPGFGFQTGAAPRPTVRIEPSAENISALEAMGFSRQRAAEALARANNNLEAAAELLLSGY